MSEITYIEKKLGKDYTIVGMIKGISKIEIDKAINLFYEINGKRNYKIGEIVKIPYEEIDNG